MRLLEFENKWWDHGPSWYSNLFFIFLETDRVVLYFFFLHLSAPNPNNLIVIFPLPTLAESETIADRRRTLIIRVKSAPNIRRNICKDTKVHEPVKFDFFSHPKKKILFNTGFIFFIFIFYKYEKHII